MSLMTLPDAYEIRFNSSGGTARLPRLLAIDDEGAKQIALLVRDHRQMEVWCGARLVATYPARCPTINIALPSHLARWAAISPTSSAIH